MIPRDVGHGGLQKARVWRAQDQARPALLLAALVALPACTERISELDPRPGLSNLFFRTHLEGREPPPGFDQAWPNLSSVPARPTPPDQATRESLSAGLAADRDRSRTPLGIAGGAALPRGGDAPPAPPRLAAVPPIRPDPALVPVPEPVARPIPSPAPLPQPAPAALPPAIPPATIPKPAAPAAAPPPAPAPELLAPPPAPSPELLAPPPPPSRDLLAPRGG